MNPTSSGPPRALTHSHVRPCRWLHTHVLPRRTNSPGAEPALKHRHSGPGHCPLKTEAPVHSQGAQGTLRPQDGPLDPECGPQPLPDLVLPRRADDTHTQHTAAFSPGDQQGRRAASRRHRGMRNGFQNSLFVSNCREPGCTANRERNSFLVALLQAFRLVVSTSQPCPREPDPGRTPPCLLHRGQCLQDSACRACRRRGRPPQPPLNPNTTWRSQVHLRPGTLSSGTTEEGIPSRPYTSLQRRRRQRLREVK